MSRSPVRSPPLALVRTVVAAIEAHGEVAAVGGSGLLAALGLVDVVRDWDVTTDAGPATVEAALCATGLPFRPAPSGDGPFATRARFAVPGPGHEVDVLVGFALVAGGRGAGMPTRVTRTWCGLPIGDPAVWLHGYRLMGRHGSADLLQGWLDGRDGG